MRVLLCKDIPLYRTLLFISLEFYCNLFFFFLLIYVRFQCAWGMRFNEVGYWDIRFAGVHFMKDAC